MTSIQFNIYGLKRSIAFADKWQQLTLSQLISVHSILYIPVKEVAYRKLFFALLDYHSVWNKLFIKLLFSPLGWLLFGKEQCKLVVATIQERIEIFLNEELNGVQLIQSFTLMDAEKRPIKFRGYFSNFEEMPFEVFINAEYEYLSYLDNGRYKHLNNLFQLMYTSDAFYSIDIVPLGLKLEAKSYFERCRKILIKNNPLIFPSPKQAESSTQKVKVSPEQLFRKWRELINDLAENKLDKVKDIEQTPIKKSLFFLSQQVENSKKKNKK